MSAAMDEYTMIGEKLKNGNMREDEPLFTLRAQDLTAPKIVRAWADVAEAKGVSKEKTEEARRLADAMDEWQKRYGCKVPD